MSWKKRWANRLFQIFVSQKIVMFAGSLLYIWAAVPAEARSNPVITAITVFGSMKAVDYWRAAKMSGGSNGTEIRQSGSAGAHEDA